MFRGARGPRLLLACVVAATLCVSGGVAVADWAGIGSRHEDLRGAVIAAVGTISEESRFEWGESGRQRWFEFREGYSTKICFSADSLRGHSTVGSSAAMLVVDRFERVRLAVLESSIGSIRVEILDPVQIECPSRY